MKVLLIFIAFLGLIAYVIETSGFQTDSSIRLHDRDSFLEKNLKTECTPSEGYSGLCKITVGKYSSCNTRAGRASVSVDCKLYDELKIRWPKERSYE